jgi:cyclohexa-1,5-dienecarbonyl-CoA hydratase
MAFTSHLLGMTQEGPFLTGSGSQTEIVVTRSKQTTATFLTGSRIGTLAFHSSHDSAAQAASAGWRQLAGIEKQDAGLKAPFVPQGKPELHLNLKQRRAGANPEIGGPGEKCEGRGTVHQDRSCRIGRRGREARGCGRWNKVGSLGRADRSHLMQINKAAREAEMLGTLALAAPKTSDFQFVKFRVEGEIARLTLDRPEHNLLNERVLMELVAGINSVSETSAVKLIVLDSAAKAFCGGIELGEYTARRVFQLLDAFHNAFSAMVETAKPILVVINGPAFGGGAELAALGDLVIATPNARFAQPEIKLGAFPPLAAAVLPYILGPKMALELVLTAETMSAERARELGLVNWLVPEKDLQKKVEEVCAKVTAQSGPVLTMAKKAILGSLGLPLREGVRNSMKVFLNELADLEDSQEGLRATVEKRAPKWKNR